MTDMAFRSNGPGANSSYHDKWAALPGTADEWIDRAGEVAVTLSQHAAKRDREGRSPRAEVDLLRQSGLLKTLGPTKYGGGGQPWDVGYKVIREVAKGDG